MFVATTRNLYCIEKSKSPQLSTIRCIGYPKRKKRKPVGLQSEIGNFRTLKLKLQFVSNKGDEFGIRGFSLGITDRIAEKSLQSIQVATVPGNLDGVPDSSFHTAGGGLECFCHLGVQYLGDGVGVLTARLGAFWMGSVKPP